MEEKLKPLCDYDYTMCMGEKCGTHRCPQYEPERNLRIQLAAEIEKRERAEKDASDFNSSRKVYREKYRMAEQALQKSEAEKVELAEMVKIQDEHLRFIKCKHREYWIDTGTILNLDKVLAKAEAIIERGD